MTKFKDYLNERVGEYGSGISFVDIDETLFKTFAKILVKDKDTGEVVRKLDNQEFNSYVLKPNEEYDFWEFRDSDIFVKTSIPIPKVINRIKKMIHKIETSERGKGSKIIFLTAREDFNNKDKFLDFFEEHGIKIRNRSIVYIERVGNIQTGTIPNKKKNVILDYLRTGKYRRVRMIDDHAGNLKSFLEIEKSLPKEIENNIRKRYNVPPEEDVIEFFALYVKPDGTLQRIN